MLFAWLSALGFFCKSYYDFSGYSDMAIGPGADSGLFTSPENFPVSLLLPIRQSSGGGGMTLALGFGTMSTFPLGGNRTGKPCWMGEHPVGLVPYRSVGIWSVELSPMGDCSTPYCCWEKSFVVWPFLAKMPWFSHLSSAVCAPGLVLFQGGSLGRAGRTSAPCWAQEASRLSQGKPVCPCGIMASF